MRTRLTAAVFVLAACTGFGGNLRGLVLDSSGSAVPMARATLYNASQTVLATAQSGNSGEFVIPKLSPGRYLLVVSRKGFADRPVPVSIAGDADQELRIELGVNPVEAEVTVSAEAGQVDTANTVAQRVNVISRGEIFERSATALTEVAEGETGLQQVRTSPGMGSFMVRGLTGKNVAVFRDGVRYTTSAQRGGVSTFQNLFDASSLDAAEFLRGPNSAQYGSDSLGGTVNLVSRSMSMGAAGAGQSGPVRGEVEPFYSYGTQGGGGSLLVSHSGPRLGFVSTLVARRSNRFRPGGGLESRSAVTRFFGLPSSTFYGPRLPDTAVTQYGGSFHGQINLSPHNHLVAHYERGQQDGGKRWDQLEGGDGNLIADLRNLMSDFAYLRYLRTGFSFADSVSITGSYNAQREERVNQGGNGNPNGTITHQYERTRVLGTQAMLDKQRGRHALSAGADFYDEAIRAPSHAFNPATRAVTRPRPRVPDGASYRSYGAFAQDSVTLTPSLRASGAIRFGGAAYRSIAPVDSVSTSAVSGRAGLVWQALKPLSLHSFYSRGFRAPNVTDLGTLGLQGNGVFEANFTDLATRNATIGDRADDRAVSTGLAVERIRPETSGNFDIGARLQTSRFSTEATAFWLNLGNSIISQTAILPQGAVGQALGDQIISRQLASGAVFVPISTSPVLVRANFSGARIRGFEHSARVRLTSALTFNENFTWIRAEDSRTGLPPDIEPGTPPAFWNGRVLWSPQSRRLWLEGYTTVAGRLTRLSSLALADRRIGAARSRANIANYFNNGATARGWVSGGRLIATGETLAQVQQRVLGAATAAVPLYNAIPGWVTFGFRAGVPLGESADAFVDASNLTDRNYRTIGSGLDGLGRSVTLKFRVRF